LTRPDIADESRFDLDVLTQTGELTLPQRGEQSDHAVKAGHHVEDRDAGTVGGPVGVAGQAHHPRYRLHDEVVPRQPRPLGSAEPADRQVDQRRVDRLGRLVVEPELGQAPRLEVLDGDVGAAKQLVS
jgi:hypothetical protein